MAKLGVRTVDELVGRTDHFNVSIKTVNSSKHGKIMLDDILDNPFTER